LTSLKRDNVSATIKNEPLILMYGNLLAENCAEGNEGNIRQKLRQLARLLEVMQTRDQCKNELSYFFVPEKFDDVVEGVILVCMKNDSEKEAKITSICIPSLAIKLGHLLKKACTVLIGRALRVRDTETVDDAEAILKIYNAEWTARIAAQSRAIMLAKKRNKGSLLPLTTDLVKFSNFLNQKIRALSTDIEAPNSSIGTYIDLRDAVLAELIFFNKRRGGEAARMTVKAFAEAKKWQEKDIESVLSETEKRLCAKMTLVEIEGKRGTVPVLLTPRLVNALNLLIKHRSTFGMDKKNLFMFPRQHGMNY
jgi:hypothetical protein